jgi:putative membrane protein
MMYRGSGMFGFGGIVGILIIAIAIYFVMKYPNQNNNSPNIFKKKESALDILKEKYAKGEIDEEEYIKKKNMLEE